MLCNLQKSFKKPDRTFIVIDHVNKLVDKVNISRMINCDGLKSHFPVKSDYYSSPSVSFSYSKTIRSAIVNYKETLLDPDFGNITCHCDQYLMEYINAHHVHIVTGNVNIVLNKDLRSIFHKEFGYHDQHPCNKILALKAIHTAVDLYINNVSPKLSVHVSGFCEVKQELSKLQENLFRFWPSG